jgi:predicted acetyltransferase
MESRDPLPIRPVGEDDLDRFIRATDVAFSSRIEDKVFETAKRIAEADRMLAAFDGDAIVATAAGATFQLTVPGGAVPAAGVTAVAVHPTHRRRGILRALMDRQLREVRERGEPAAILWASEPGIYGRFGYGLAAYGLALKVDRSRARFATALGDGVGRTRLLDRSHAVAGLSPVYDAVRVDRPGMIDRPGAWWEHWLVDTESHEHGEGFGPLFFALHEGDEGPDGYAVYRFKHDWGEGSPRGTVSVEELVATTPDALAAMWRFCIGIDLAAEVVAWNRPVDDPLLHLLTDARQLRPRLHDSLWVRPVDVAALLSARRYPVEGGLRLRVVDDVCEWVDGTYELEGGPGGASCQAAGGEPDLELAAADLGAIVLGGVRPSALLAAGRVLEGSPGAVRRADSMFAWDSAPWSTFVF